MIKFRTWCHQVWYEHLDEVLEYEGQIPAYTAKTYFEKYRWWLRREYRRSIGE